MHRLLEIILVSVLALPATAAAQSSRRSEPQLPAVPPAPPAPAAPVLPGRRAETQAERAYQRGTAALDERQWEKAVQAFSEVPKDALRADGALYWTAYAKQKLGRRTEALADLAEFQKSFPNSR
jgi:tetratricopeptide (TPR) repeat protein